MENIGIVAKTASPLAKEGLRIITEWLGERGLAYMIEEETAKRTGFGEGSTWERIADSADLIVVMGGDGTFLGAARMMVSRVPPILGINLGGLGFLTEFAYEDMLPTLERVIDGDYMFEDRIMLDIQVIRKGKETLTYTALNDLVINRRAHARMVDIRVSVDGLFVNEYTADGLIISTPTGSTAYNLSAHGPIVHPSLAAMILTPICPHTLSNRPVVIPDNVTMELSLSPVIDTEAVATVDGQVGFELNSQDRIVARRSKHVTRVILSENKNYFQILREKLKWGETLRQDNG